jgi:hypothetical protein
MVIVQCYVYVREFNWQMYLEIVEFCHNSIFYCSYKSLNLTIGLMYASPKLGIP